jgi:hypothetical protein
VEPGAELPDPALWWLVPLTTGDLYRTAPGLNKATMTSITCKLCGMTSYNPNDVINRYCGHCHQFLQALELDRDPRDPGKDIKGVPDSERAAGE